MMYYVDFILLYTLQKDLVAYDHLLQGSVNSWSQIGALGLQGIGSNCMYAMGMMVGAYIIRFVPEVSSWLIPGGVSSSAGSTAGAAAVGALSATAGAGMTAGSAVYGGTTSVTYGLSEMGKRNLKGDHMASTVKQKSQQ